MVGLKLSGFVVYPSGHPPEVVSGVQRTPLRRNGKQGIDDGQSSKLGIVLRMLGIRPAGRGPSGLPRRIAMAGRAAIRPTSRAVGFDDPLRNGTVQPGGQTPAGREVGLGAPPPGDGGNPGGETRSPRPGRLGRRTEPDRHDRGGIIPPTGPIFHFAPRHLAPGRRRETQVLCGLDRHKALGGRGFQSESLWPLAVSSPTGTRTKTAPNWSTNAPEGNRRGTNP